jgi:hypothetical protein
MNAPHTIRTQRRNRIPTVKTSTAILACITTFVAVATSAQAANMSLTFNGLGPSKNLKINYNASRQFNQNASGGFQTYASGRMKWTKSNSNGASVHTFCTQIAETISSGQTVNFGVTTVESVPDPVPGPMGSIRAQLVRDLYARHYNTVKSSTSGNLNAAFQLAIWEITHENLTASNAQDALAQLNVGTGALAVNMNNGTTATVASLAMQLIGSLGVNGFVGFGNLLGLTDPLAQDQLVVVPIPMTLGLAAVGLAGVVAMRRRRG